METVWILTILTLYCIALKSIDAKGERKLSHNICIPSPNHSLRLFKYSLLSIQQSGSFSSAVVEPDGSYQRHWRAILVSIWHGWLSGTVPRCKFRARFRWRIPTCPQRLGNERGEGNSGRWSSTRQPREDLNLEVNLPFWQFWEAGTPVVSNPAGNLSQQQVR